MNETQPTVAPEVDAPSQIRLRCRLGWHHWTRWKLERWQFEQRTAWIAVNYRKCHACGLTQTCGLENDDL